MVDYYFVGVVYISPMILVMMQMHRLLIDIRLKRAIRIVKRRQSIGEVHISTTIKRKLVHRVRLLSTLALDPYRECADPSRLDLVTLGSTCAAMSAIFLISLAQMSTC